jgi:hypothetical protein
MKETIETPATPQQQSSYSDGGPAIPLRDWFAGQALAGVMAHKDSVKWSPNAVASDCYDYAAAMLKAREVKP